MNQNLEQQNQGLIEYQSRQNQNYHLISECEESNAKIIAELEKKNQNLERQNQSLIEYQSTLDNNKKVIVFQEMLEDPLETVPEDNDQG